MITPYQKPEGKDDKASNFWTNLAGKLGLSAPLVRQASAAEQKVQRLSDGLQKHSDLERSNPASFQTTPEFWDCECESNYIHPAAEGACKACGSHRDESPDARVDEVIKLLGVTPTQVEDHGPAGPAREASIQTVSQQDAASAALIKRYSGVFQRAVGELGQSERVKAADRLSRIEADMAAFKDKMAGMGGDEAMTDLVGEVSAKADAVSGACVQLRDKVGGLSMPQAAAIENAFLVLSDAKTYLDKLKTPASNMGGGAMGAEMGMPSMPDLELMDGGIPDMPPTGAEPKGPSPVAGRVMALVKKAMDEAYDDVRCIHTKLLLVESLLSSLVSELNVSDMIGPSSVATPGMPPSGMPPTDQVEGEQKPLEGDADLKELGARCKGRMAAFAASGDPGDSEPGNTIYKDLGKCRDCVWFESDWTHETYRDKCKHCTHASLGGAVDHFWPRSQQMIVWSPQWSAPAAKEKKAFFGTLGLGQTAQQVSAAAVEIAAEIMATAAHTAVDLGSELMSYFHDPVASRSMSAIAHEVAAEIKEKTGVEIGVSASLAKSWGLKSATIAVGEVAIACDTSLVHLAKGEKRKIKELRQQLDGEKDPAKIKSLNDAIDSLYSRMDSDKKRKQERRDQREEKRKKDQEAADKEPAKLPNATAKFVGTLCAAEPKPCCGPDGYCDACDRTAALCVCGTRDASPTGVQGTLCLSQARGSLRVGGGKSKCECGHTGDGAGSQHDGHLGHGSCRMCPCHKFTWAGEIVPGAAGQGFKPNAKEPMKSKAKDFKVVAVSKNTNSFGLHGVVMIAEDGEGWEAAHGPLELPEQGDILQVSMDDGGLNWAAVGFEIPRRLPQAPKDVVSQVWGQREASSSGRSL